MKKWTLRIVGALVALLVVALGVVYVASARAMARTYPFRAVPLTLPTDSASLARGAHLVDASCRGCHSETLQGAVMFEQAGVARLVAPNVIEKLARYSDAEFAGFMRYGVRKDGTSLMVMPPPGFYHMSDADLAAIIAYLRTLPAPQPAALPVSSYGPLGRLGMMMGQFETAVHYIDTTVARVGADSAYLTTRRGEYLVRMICAECHGLGLTGDPARPSPSLAGAAGYDLAAFTTLLRTGTPRLATTKLTLMAEVAKANLRKLTDDEISAIHGYLSALPQTGVPGLK